MTVSTPTPLTGAELLAAHKANKGATAHELCKVTGYYSVNKKGKEVCNIAGMQKAMLIAMGVNIGSDNAAGKGPGGRKLSYTATVQGNGNLLIGKAYTALLDLEPGDEFTIKLGKKAIRLIPTGAAAEHAESAEGAPEGEGEE